MNELYLLGFKFCFPTSKVVSNFVISDIGIDIGIGNGIRIWCPILNYKISDIGIS